MGLERSKVIPDANAVLDAVRSNGRQGVKPLVTDRPHRIAQADDTTWRPDRTKTTV